MATTNEPRLVARWTHPRGKAFVELRAHEKPPHGAHVCYQIRAQGASAVLWLLSDDEAIRETERRIGIGLYTPDSYKTAMVRSV